LAKIKLHDKGGNKMKKFNLLGLFSILMLTLVLAACGGNAPVADDPVTADPAPPAQAQADPTPAPATAPADIVTLNWYMPHPDDPEDFDLVFAAINEYLAQYGLAINIVSLGWGELADMNEFCR
jgi:ABC-type glycerol-3-phosphate transport system substrate-binding protein